MRIDLTEFNKAEEMLKERGINYSREDRVEPIGLPDRVFERHIIKAVDENDKWLWDFICSTGSYGGEEKGLLEYWSKKKRDAGDDPDGWLTAEEVIQKIEVGE